MKNKLIRMEPQEEAKMKVTDINGNKWTEKGREKLMSENFDPVVLHMLRFLF